MIDGELMMINIRIMGMKMIDAQAVSADAQGGGCGAVDGGSVKGINTICFIICIVFVTRPSKKGGRIEGWGEGEGGREGVGVFIMCTITV